MLFLSGKVDQLCVVLLFLYLGGNMTTGSVGFIMEISEHFPQARGGCPTGESNKKE